MRKPFNSENSRIGGSQGLQVVSRVLTYLTIVSLFCACIVLSILLKGAKEAHHELWQELLDQEKKTANAYQDVAADKVVVVEAEEKANVALRDLSFCKQDLDWSKTEINQFRDRVNVLEKERDDLNGKIGECEESNKDMSLELEECRSERQALQTQAGTAVDMIDGALEEGREMSSTRRTRRRKKRSPDINLTDQESTTDDALQDSQEVE